MFKRVVEAAMASEHDLDILPLHQAPPLCLQHHAKATAVTWTTYGNLMSLLWF